MHKIFVVFLICTGKYALAIRIQNLPCFTDESQKDLEDARKELTTVDNYLEKTVEMLTEEFQKTLNIMKNQLVTMKTNVSKIVKKVETDLIVMEKDLEDLDSQLTFLSTTTELSQQSASDWETDNASDRNNFNQPNKQQKLSNFKTSRLCRDYGGYLVKIDNSTENEWLQSNRPSKSIGYWLGLTDLIEGEWRWSIDQSLATFKTWQSGYGSKGHTSNCVSFSGGRSTWFDTSCKIGYYYICERNFCKYFNFYQYVVAFFDIL
ncbi:unnamed protein product [Mytilus coruscus]|uniref:C-type lectin domain-containing protein n=1 Tax=Mytilus coruscus TaxID=42192 RepID=A0A6J8A7V8_MYTCO|nr:unnamed protein product [Mytilus coruscus]